MLDAMQVPLRGAIKGVWNVLAYHAGVKDQCWPALETIAVESGYSRKTVCVALDELERLNLIRRASPEGGNPTRYFVNPEAASQFTVKSLHTKERQKEGDCDDRVTGAARRELELAKAAIRRRQVRETFVALCGLYPGDVKITAPMIARELGSRPSSVRADINYLLKHMDIPFEHAGRFARTKPNHKAIARARNIADRANVVPFAGRSR